MMTLVTGPAGSGKSHLAEHLAGASGGRVYYIATMKVMDEEGERRVQRHRMMREGKGFVTIEIPCDVASVLNMEDISGSTVLLECAANLVGNLMHDHPRMSQICRSGAAGEKEFVRMVSEQISRLDEACRELIVVTSEYEPEALDDPDTALFKKILGMVNITLANMADRVYDTSADAKIQGEIV